MLIHITFRNTSMRWNMKRSNGFPEFSAGLLLFDCCFSPLNNIDKCEAIGIMMTMGCTFQNSEVLMIHSYSLHMDGMGWNLYQLGWDLHGPWSPCGVFSRFFLSRSGRALLYLAWLIWYTHIYVQPAAAPQQTFWHVLGHHNASLTCLLFREILCETVSPRRIAMKKDQIINVNPGLRSTMVY